MQVKSETFYMSNQGHTNHFMLHLFFDVHL